MTKLKRFPVEFESAPGGWTRWLNPKMDGYVLVCCDCGLAHRMEFRAFLRGPVSADGRFRTKRLPMSKYGVTFRARRAPRYTRKARRAKARRAS